MSEVFVFKLACGLLKVVGEATSHRPNLSQYEHGWNLRGDGTGRANILTAKHFRKYSSLRS